ncbi:unnamed protein product [Mytilus coruscus]|uniref:TRIM71 n=1 Tax=Mytilus coruscus TaxID=42192 RepID=A0A6J8A0P6_MYTCO|nr:unnamed protein product [Mytilus coruscus]
MCSTDDIISCMSNAHGQMTQFLKAKLLKGSVKILKQMDIECIDFAISFKDKILFSPEPRNKLMAASTKKTKTKTVVNISPLVISAIHISKHNELLLGVREQGSMFPVTDLSTRLVAVFGTDYKRKSTFMRNDEGKGLFNYTSRIATDSTNNIYVIDLFNNDVGRIVSIDRTGHKRFLYNGFVSFNTQETAFNPTDIAVTSRDTTIISDCDNHALHALNVNGELIGLQITRNFDILYPCSLCIDNEGFLLIGCNEYDAKIYVVKLLS